MLLDYYFLSTAYLNVIDRVIYNLADTVKLVISPKHVPPGIYSHADHL